MDVQIVLLKDLGLFGVNGLDKAYRDLRALFHNVTQPSGYCKFSRSFGEQRLNIEDLTSHRSPGKAGYDAWPCIFRHMPVRNGMVFQNIAQILRRDSKTAAPAPYQFYRLSAAESLKSLFQTSDSAFSCVIGDYGLNSLVGNTELLILESDGSHGLGQQMPFCDLKFFDRSVTLELDHFHAV